MGFCTCAVYQAARTTQATNIGLVYGCTSAFVAAWEIATGRQRAIAMLGLGIADARCCRADSCSSAMAASAMSWCC
jgi:hypothetical protein